MSFKFNKQSIFRFLFQYVGMRGINETAVITCTMAGLNLSFLFVFTPDNQCTYFIQLYCIAVLAFSFLGGSVMRKDEF
ncbi:hypothetical protein SAMN05421863_11126 [Nitrosomonas communis]|uniref:Uncharacterized protein n=1 Tax=Nitrosomonas communis TaxID=44574 RepID=A0A1I4WLH8_9PROT|nr:hypothetical protein SAMN05421863_11126 [Nitrosomonas communis]